MCFLTEPRICGWDHFFGGGRDHFKLILAVNFRVGFFVVKVKLLLATRVHIWIQKNVETKTV